MSNSSLVKYVKISPNKTIGRTHAIDTISIHCMAGNLSVESCGDIFAKAANKASSNYGIGSDGRVALYVDEKDRSWCTSSSANDHRAITIEVANDGGAPDWHVSDKVMNVLIELVADICKRNNIKELKWNTTAVAEADKKFNELRIKGYSFDNAATTAYKNLKANPSVQNMTVHKWFSNKACPGNYLYSKMPYIASEVNKKLNPPKKTTTTATNAATQIKTAKKPAVAAPTLKKGSKGAQAKLLQQDLNYLGFKDSKNKKLVEDGDFGANTDYALKQFQKKYKLTVDGIYGKNSQTKMKSLLK